MTVINCARGKQLFASKHAGGVPSARKRERYGAPCPTAAGAGSDWHEGRRGLTGNNFPSDFCHPLALISLVVPGGAICGGGESDGLGGTVPCAPCAEWGLGRAEGAGCWVPSWDKKQQQCRDGWGGREGAEAPRAAGSAIAAGRAACPAGTGRQRWRGNGNAPSRGVGRTWTPLSPRGLEGGQGSTIRSAWLDSVRPSPWLRPWLPAGTRTGTRTGMRTDMAAPSQPHQTTYAAIVIGAGIQGSFAAYHLAQRHRDTLLLEQVPTAPALPCPHPTVSPSHRVPSPDVLGRALASAMARSGAAASIPCPQCQDPSVPSARTPMSPVPRSLCPQCQDPHVPSARTPMSPVPGPQCPQSQDPHVPSTRTPVSPVLGPQ